MNLSDLMSRYQEQTKQLDKIADAHCTHRKHLCENLYEYLPSVQERVSQILRVQIDLMIKIHQLDPTKLK